MMLTTLTRFRPASITAVALLLALSSTPLVQAQTSACDSQTNARLDFLETRLEAGRTHATWWWRGWLGVFSVGAVAQSVRAGLEDHASDRADMLFSVGKSLLGVADLTLRPHATRHGADAGRAIPTDSAENCARRLAAAEQALTQAAKEAEVRYSWTRHLTSLALNLGAAVLVSEVWDDRRTGWTSFAISEASAEAHIWSHPWRAEDDLEKYHERFDGAPTAAIDTQWQLAAGPGGLEVRWEF